MSLYIQICMYFNEFLCDDFTKREPTNRFYEFVCSKLNQYILLIYLKGVDKKKQKNNLI